MFFLRLHRVMRQRGAIFALPNRHQICDEVKHDIFTIQKAVEKMEKKSVEQQNKEFMENPNISEEDKKKTLKI